MPRKDQPIGRAKGGVARAAALTPERKLEIAKKAAAARWGEKPLRATHRGSFKDEFGIDVECYVLDDDRKTAVISQRGMGAALGFSQSSGRALPRFIAGTAIAPYVGDELREKVSSPLVFQAASTTTHGYDVTILIDLCKAINRAHQDGVLKKSQENLVRQAQVIVNASAKAGITGLVYALAGYDATREEIVAAFKLFVREEAREYEKEFPDQLYQEWYRLYQLPKPTKNKPWKFMRLTIGHVYFPLARSSGRIFELTKARRTKSADRRKKLHQFLSDVGVKALRTHLGQLLGIAQVSQNEEEYERHVRRIFGDQQSFEFEEVEDEPAELVTDTMAITSSS